MRRKLAVVFAASAIAGLLAVVSFNPPVRMSAKGPALTPAALVGPPNLLPCSTAALAGHWVFATDVGHQSIVPGQTGDITAIGTINLDAQGNADGTFDFTVADYMFFGGNTQTATMTVNPDCTGTVDLSTSIGSHRTDSIVVVNSNEFWGMSQDPHNLWTYKAHRISY